MAHGRDEDAQQRGERRRLGADRHEGRRGRGRALVDVGRPGMERHQRDLEADAHGQDADRQQQHWVAQVGLLEDGRDLGQVGLTRDAVQPGHAVNQDGRSEGAQQEVLQRSFIGSLLAAGQAGQDVDRDDHQLDRHEQRDQVGRGGGEHHAQHGEREQAVELAERQRPLSEIGRGHERHQDGRGQEQRVEVDGEVVQHHRAGIRRHRAAAPLIQVQRLGHHEAQQSQPGQLALLLLAQDRFEDEHQHGQRRNHDLRHENVGADHLTATAVPAPACARMCPTEEWSRSNHGSGYTPTQITSTTSGRRYSTS